MKLTLPFCAILVISADFSLLFLPDFALITTQSAVIFAAVLGVAAGLALYFRRKPLADVLWASLIFIVALGYCHNAARTLLNQAQSVSVEKRQLVLNIQEILHQQDYQTLIAQTNLAENQPPQRIFINWKVEVAPQIGEQWQAEVQLRPLSARLNFGGFDRQQWFFAKGVTAVGNVKSAVKISGEFSVRGKMLQQARAQTTGLSLQGLLIALSFGERAWLDNNTWQIYQQTNTAHLIAISGLHIGLAMGMGFLLVRGAQIFLPTRFISPLLPLICGAIFALGYAYLAGFSVPTFRAVVALILVLSLQIRRRYYSPFQLLTLVVAVLLLCDPLMPLSSSFWLSAGAVFCLLLWYRAVPFSLFQWQYRPFPPKVRWILGLFHLQFGLLLLFTPLQVFLFNGTAANGFLANLIAVPLYSFFLVPLILFAVITQGAFYSWEIANQLAHWITQIIAYFQGDWWAVSFNLWLFLTALCSLIFLILVLWFHREEKLTAGEWRLKPARFFTLNRTAALSKNQQGVMIAVGLFVIIGCAGIWAYQQVTKPIWKMETLDVGQGLATLIVKNGEGILYDTGAAWAGGSMAELEILPYLRREGITLERLILSHDDNDHSGGANAILQAYTYLLLMSPSKKSYGETRRESCVAEKTWHWQGLQFRVLSPPNEVARATNPDSCVIVIDDGVHRVLLTGDAEVKNEREFARTLGKISVLQVGHHGSKTATGEFLLSKIRPDIAVISSGRWNPWKFPHSSVTERLKRYESAVENTAISGQVSIKFYANRMEIERARADFSPWYARVIGLSAQ